MDGFADFFLCLFVSLYQGWALCPSGEYMVGGQLRSDGTGHSSGGRTGGIVDDYAALNFRILCSDGTYAGGLVGWWPSGYGGFDRLQQCTEEGDWVCGLRVKYEEDRGDGKDNTALNQLQLQCCGYGKVSHKYAPVAGK